MQYEKRENDRDEELAKIYQRVARYSFFSSFSVGDRLIRKWAKIQGKKVPPAGRISMVKVARFYYSHVIKNGLQNIGVIELKYMGKVFIQQVNAANGRPRTIINKEGEYEQVMQDVFSETPKYIYSFVAQYTKIRKGLRPFIACGIYRQIVSLYLPIVYSLHPGGNFYPFKK